MRFGDEPAKIRAESPAGERHGDSGGINRLELGLSLLGPFVLLGIAGSLGGLAAILFLSGALAGLGIAAAAFGADSRDGADW